MVGCLILHAPQLSNIDRGGSTVLSRKYQVAGTYIQSFATWRLLSYPTATYDGAKFEHRLPFRTIKILWIVEFRIIKT
jgi:hypothetical protein